jgi:hypothetical protein
MIMNGNGQAFSLPNGMGESVESESKNTKQMKHNKYRTQTFQFLLATSKHCAGLCNTYDLQYSPKGNNGRDSSHGNGVTSPSTPEVL